VDSNIYLKYLNRQNKSIQLRDAYSTAISPTPRQTVDGETKEKIIAVCKIKNNMLKIIITNNRNCAKNT
jgi:hypothetical protein